MRTLKQFYNLVLEKYKNITEEEKIKNGGICISIHDLFHESFSITF